MAIHVLKQSNNMTFKDYMVKTHVDTLNIKERLPKDVERVLVNEGTCRSRLQILVSFDNGLFHSQCMHYPGGDKVELVYPKVKDFTKEDANKWFADNGFTKGDWGWKLEY